jgi:hypothetical protein
MQSQLQKGQKNWGSCVLSSLLRGVGGVCVQGAVGSRAKVLANLHTTGAQPIPGVVSFSRGGRGCLGRGEKQAQGRERVEGALGRAPAEHPFCFRALPKNRSHSLAGKNEEKIIVMEKGGEGAGAALFVCARAQTTPTLTCAGERRGCFGGVGQSYWLRNFGRRNCDA